MGDISVEVDVVGATVALSVEGAPTVEVLEVAVPGPRGIQGERGERGPIYNGEDLPDFTLIFNNQLV